MNGYATSTSEDKDSMKLPKNIVIPGEKLVRYLSLPRMCGDDK